MKGQKIISLTEEVLKNIRNRTKHYGFNFSEWVENRYKNEFLNVNQKLQEIEEHNKKILILKEEIKQTQVLEKAFKEALSRSEIRFIKSVPRLLYEGKVLKSLCQRFNLMFKKDIYLDDFTKMVEFFKKDENRKHR